MTSKQSIQFLATVASGIESLVKKEVSQRGYDVQVDNGKVFFKGNLSTIPEMNLWLRFADRLKIVMGEFTASSFEELFEACYALEWEKWLPVDANFPVSGKSIQSKLYSVPDCQAIVKKAIVKRLQDVYHRRGFLPESGALYPIEVAIRKDKVQLTIDTSGSSLFKRGYRIAKGDAPLKENMAAALVGFTNWHKDKPFADPFCGSGTIPIEAALMGLNIAPGLNRSFNSQDWLFLPKDLWDKEIEAAENSIDYDSELLIEASDIDHRMIEVAKANAEEAGVADHIHFKQCQIKDFTSKEKNGILVTNPPYGGRLLDEEKVHLIYQDMGQALKPLDTWSKYILTSDLSFETYYGQKATKRRKLYNGAIRTDLFQYWAKRKN